MINTIIKTTKRIRLRMLLKRYHNFLNIPDTCILLEAMNIFIRDPLADKKYISIGSGSIINGQFIIEKSEGKIFIGERVHIGEATKLISINSIEIGNDVTIAWDCTIYDHNSHSIYWEERKKDTINEYNSYVACKDMVKNKNWNVVKSSPIKIRDRVWIGFGVTILKGVTIGEGSVIAACSVVTKDVPPNVVVAGNPAQIVKELNK